jgi:hypothetical protein
MTQGPLLQGIPPEFSTLVISPRAILAGHPHHQVFDLSTDARTANRRLGLGTIALLMRKPAVPREDGVGLSHRRQLFQGLLAHLLAQLGERFAVAVRELDATRNLLAEHAILCGHIGIAQPELFVNRRVDCPEQFLPVHPSTTPAKTFYMKDQYGRKRSEIQAEACVMVEA